MGEMFELLMEGLNEVLEEKKGLKKLRTRVVHIPEPATNYGAQDVKRIRKTLHYSQSLFAAFLNISTKTVQSWEAGRRTPTHAALRLLEVVDKGLYRPQSFRKRMRLLTKNSTH